MRVTRLGSLKIANLVLFIFRTDTYFVSNVSYISYHTTSQLQWRAFQMYQQQRSLACLYYSKMQLPTTAETGISTQKRSDSCTCRRLLRRRSI